MDDKEARHSSPGRGSSHYWERPTAGAIAHQFIRSRNLTWSDGIAAKPEPEQWPRTWRDGAKYCRANDEFLMNLKRSFLNLIAMQLSLTARQ